VTTTLDVRGASFGYGGHAVVRDLSIELHEGEVVALLGANGAGKTTTLLGLSGLVERLGGEIDLRGASITTLAPEVRAKRGLAHVPEERALFTDLTVLENLQVGQHSRRKSVEAALDRCPELRRLLNRRAGLLSGGEQQMLAVARALAGEPRVLLLDEMSLGLAPLIVERLLVMIRELATSTGCAVLLVEQHVHQALAVADRGYVLRRGEIVLSGKVDQLNEDLEALEASYLSAGRLDGGSR